MQVKKLTHFNKSIIKDLNILLVQFPRDYKISPSYFKKLIKKSHVLALYDKDTIVGSLTLVEMYKLSGFKGSLEHLIVHKDYRGQGLGKKLMNYAIDLGKKLKMEALFLTVDTDNIPANSLYKKLGFKLQKSNFYQLKLK